MSSNSRAHEPILWHCLQLGSREHYAVPRTLDRAGILGMFVTDAWTRPRTPLGLVGGKARGRWHPDLAEARVQAPKFGRYVFELRARLRGSRGWQRVIERNQWFQQYALKQLLAAESSSFDIQPILFSYSYAALEPFRWAKSRGWKTVLGQIDPGPLEHDVVDRDSASFAHMAQSGARPPRSYWEQWRQEVEFSDLILVNSEWSKKLLSEGSVPPSKMRIVPLAYEDALSEHSARSRGGAAPACEKKISVTDGGQQRLRVLFLGQINLRKGSGQIFNAIRILRDEPIDFRFVGPKGMTIPESIRQQKNVRFLPPVPRQLTAEQYRWADIFLLPTLSDGFAITQLEALAHGVPVIASRRCGDVVRHEENGLLLDSVTPESIANALLCCLRNRELVERLSSNACVEERFTVSSLEKNLCSISEELAAI